MHAIVLVLNDVELFSAALQAIYPFIDAATVVTTYDRDRFGQSVVPEGLVELILSRTLDPDRKVNLLVPADGGEPRQRNRAMAFAANADPVVPLTGEPPHLRTPSVFWHVDADEIYDAAEVPRLLDWVRAHPARLHQIDGLTYFRTWNWRVRDQVPFVAFTRPGLAFGNLRHPYPALGIRVRSRLARSLGAPRLADRLRGVKRIPPEIAVCHHGSYIGNREKIEQKLERSGHRSEMRDRWLSEVWDQWHPDMRDFHPVRPTDFPAAEHVPTERLPDSIAKRQWPDGWIER